MTQAVSFLRLIVLFTLSALCSQSVAENINGKSVNTSSQQVIHHSLQVQPDITSGSVRIFDTLTLPNDYAYQLFSFELNAAFSVFYNEKKLTPAQKNQHTNFYRIQLRPQQKTIALNYHGNVASTPSCQWTREVCSLLNETGIYFGPGLAWYPMHSNQLQSFDLKVNLPEGWHSLSQGTEITTNHWQEKHPQDAIYLVAAKFHVYTSTENDFLASVYLLKDEPDLAQRYLKATHRYIKDYSAQLGDYPYSKFATIESFWESGWGMPSFTMLGSKVMRLPFIIYTSFPHEILHNWWGNGVFIDASKGNWSEGLTAYLADHAIKEQRGQGLDYRRSALQKYAAFTKDDNDFPIAEFRSRHNQATQAVGYSKLLMVYHMLRMELGDDVFYQALKTFNETYQFKNASFDDLKVIFSKAANKNIDAFFTQWITRKGAPQITIKSWVQNTAEKTLNLSLIQKQQADPFQLDIPIAIYQGDQLIETQIISLNQREQAYSIKLPTKADSVAIDPEFDVLRTPSANELPKTLHTFSDQSNKLLQITTNATSYKVWNNIAQQLIKQDPEQYAIAESSSSAGAGKTVLRLGLASSGKHKDMLELTQDAYIIAGKRYPRDTHSIAFADGSSEQSIISLDAPDLSQAITLFRKLRHYGKYSYLVFDQNGKNVLKGQWEARNSPLKITLKP